MGERLVSLVLGVLCASVAGGLRADVGVTRETGVETPATAHAAFFEEISRAGEGGLHAELLANRDFEALGRLQGGALDPASVSPWAVAGAAAFAPDDSDAPFATNPVALAVWLAGGGNASAVLTNPGFDGIHVRESVTYHVAIWAKAAEGVSVAASLLCDDKTAASPPALMRSVRGTSACGPAPRPGWKRLGATLVPYSGCSRGVLALELSAATATTVRVDGTSLLPGDAVKGVFRRDLFDRIQALRPSFLRFPGGNYLEGSSFETRWDWKKGVGRPEARPGHLNSAWNYWVSDALGLYEYLLLAEALGAEPQLSVYTGFSMGRPYVPLNESAQFARDALDALEFANGDRSTRWGAVRAAMGHEAPFGLRRLEVGNEERDMAQFAAHYALITEAVWQADPSVLVVASGKFQGASITGSPCETQRCDLADEHYYLMPDAMFGMFHAYDPDRRPRNGATKVYVGEYASYKLPPGSGAPPGETLWQALGDAANLLGLERNGDLVLASSFAPLMANAKHRSWAYNLVTFNASAHYVSPAWHALVMLRGALGERTLQARVSGDVDAVVVSHRKGSVHVKLVNYADSALHLSLDLSLVRGVLDVLDAPTATVLTAPDRLACNTLESPDAVAPGSVAVTCAGPRCLSASVVLPPWSLAAVHVPTRSLSL